MKVETRGGVPFATLPRVVSRPGHSGALRIGVYHNLHSGGAKRVVQEQVQRLSVRHSVQVWTTTMADVNFGASQDAQVAPFISPFYSLREAPSPWGRLNPALRMTDLARFNLMSRRLAGDIDAQGYDVVLVHPCQVTQAPLLLDWLRTPAFYVCQELPRSLYEPAIPRPLAKREKARRALDRVDPLIAAHSLLLKILDRHSARRATTLVSNSNFSAGNIQAAYGREASVCYPGVDVAAFRPVAREREPFVLSVGALTPAKGFDWIIRALATLPAGQRWPLVLVSNYQEPEEREFLSRLAKENEVNVEFKIGIGDAQLREWYARAGCVAYSPVREPFGLVALEAMAAAAPIVGVAEGGVRETILDGLTGLLTPREPEAFGAAIRRLMTQPEYACRLGLDARQEMIEHWTWDRHVDQLEGMLEQMVGAQRNEV